MHVDRQYMIDGGKQIEGVEALDVRFEYRSIAALIAVRYCSVLLRCRQSRERVGWRSPGVTDPIQG